MENGPTAFNPVRIRFRTTTKLEIGADFLQTLEISNVFLTFDQLVELKINTVFLSLHRFFQENPTISKKIIQYDCWESSTVFLKIGEMLGNLQTIETTWFITNTKNIKNFIDKCTSLQYLEFNIPERSQKEYRTLKENLGDEWNSSYENFKVNIPRN